MLFQNFPLHHLNPSPQGKWQAEILLQYLTQSLELLTGAVIWFAPDNQLVQAGLQEYMSLNKVSWFITTARAYLLKLSIPEPPKATKIGQGASTIIPKRP